MGSRSSTNCGDRPTAVSHGPNEGALSVSGPSQQLNRVYHLETVPGVTPRDFAWFVGSDVAAETGRARQQGQDSVQGHQRHGEWQAPARLRHQPSSPPRSDSKHAPHRGALTFQRCTRTSVRCLHRTETVILRCHQLLVLRRDACKGSRLSVAKTIEAATKNFQKMPLKWIK